MQTEQNKDSLKLVVSDTKTNAAFYLGELQIGPTFTAKNPLVTTIVWLSTMFLIDDQTYKDMLYEVGQTKMPSINISMPMMSFGMDIYGMRFGTPMCEHKSFTNKLDEFFQMFGFKDHMWFKSYRKTAQKAEPVHN